MKTNIFIQSKIRLCLIVLIILVISLLILTKSSTKPSISTEALREEFGDTYLSEVESTGNTVEVDLIAKESEIEIIDGKKTKIWSYNSQTPLDPITINLGDTLIVKLTNELPQDTTIHWHGVRVDNQMDGVPGVTQEPIKPGEVFVYEITPKDAGTYWFHPHINGTEQLDRGLYAPLIVSDKNSLPYSQDIVWVIDDWRLDREGQIIPNFNNTHDISHDGRLGNTITVNKQINLLQSVQPGQRIRLRLINSSNARIYKPRIDSLRAMVIAVDGHYVTEAFELGDFELAPGNRIDLDITIPKENQQNDIFVKDSFYGEQLVLAKLNIVGDSVDTPEFNFPSNPSIPNWSEAKNAKMDYKYNLRTKGMGHMMSANWTINNLQYPDYQKYLFKYNEFNKIKITNDSFRLHPMHLHGVFFKVVSKNGKPANENFFRDTILLKANESVELALVPLDKGNWAIHCHTQSHGENGMMSIFSI